ncbi:MAG TPA: hypothetical protein VGJ21_04835 [Terracidiphilus sp.]|jgi:hypothetical protein
MNAIEAALGGLIDYAGLYPPAALDMATAVRNYLDYRGHRHAWMLGRFLVDLTRLDELLTAASERACEMPLSVIAAPGADLDAVERNRRRGLRIEALEIKCDEPLKIARTCEHLPPDVECYFEIPIRASCSGAIDAMAAVNVRAKLRLGGVTAEAFPAIADVANRLHLLADRRVAFKATAGLHHPFRSRHRLTYANDSPQAMMHGFINLIGAAAVVHFGGSAEEAAGILEIEKPDEFQFAADCIAVGGHAWTAAQIRDMRQCFTSFGSCSFTEPIHDLEALGWL